MRHVRITTKSGEEIEGYVFRDDDEIIGIQTEPQRLEFALADVADIEPLADEDVEPVTSLDTDTTDEPAADA